MWTDSLRTRTAGVDRPLTTAVGATVDSAFAARSTLIDLRNTLAAAVRQRRSRRNRWGEPPVFFFDSACQAELERSRPAASKSDSRSLTASISSELPELMRSVEVRRVARAIPGLREAAAALAAECPAAKDLAELLTVADDEAVLVLHPAKRVGFRLLVRGVHDVSQFHILMLASATGELRDGLLPGTPVSELFVAACRDCDPVVPAGVSMVAEARFQLFKPTAVQADGSVREGFAGCRDWLWGQQALTTIPRVNGERVVVLGDPAFRATWEIDRRFPGVQAEVKLVQVLNPFQVAEHLSRFAGQPVPVRQVEEQAASIAKAA